MTRVQRLPNLGHVSMRDGLCPHVASLFALIHICTTAHTSLQSYTQYRWVWAVRVSTPSHAGTHILRVRVLHLHWLAPPAVALVHARGSRPRLPPCVLSHAYAVTRVTST